MHGTERYGRGPLRVTALLTLVIVLSAAASAEAAPTWLQPVTLSDTAQSATDTEVAMDPKGNVVAVWSRSNGTNTIVQARFRPAGGSFGSVQNLSAPGANASYPSVDMDANGNAVAVWLRGGVVQIAGRPAGGSFAPGEDVSDSSVAASVPDLEVAANGTAIATWVRGGFAQAIVRQPNGSLGAPQTISGAGVRAFAPCCRADIAMNARGDAVVSWDEDDQEVRATYRPAGGSFGAAPGQLLASSSCCTGSAIDPDGNATVVWKSNTANAIQGSFRAAGASNVFTPGDTVSLSTNGIVPTVAMDSEGTAIAAWVTEPGYVIQTATRRLNQAFSPAQNITPAGLQAVYPMVVVDGQDGVLVTWRRIPDGGGGTYIIQGASRSKNGPFDVRNVSQPGVPFFSRPTLDADANGNGVVGWHRFDGTRNIAQTSGFDLTRRTCPSLARCRDTPVRGSASRPRRPTSGQASPRRGTSATVAQPAATRCPTPSGRPVPTPSGPQPGTRWATAPRPPGRCRSPTRLSTRAPGLALARARARRS